MIIRELKGLTLKYDSDQKRFHIIGNGRAVIPRRQLYSVLVFILRIYRSKRK